MTRTPTVRQRRRLDATLVALGLVAVIVVALVGALVWAVVHFANLAEAERTERQRDRKTSSAERADLSHKLDDNSDQIAALTQAANVGNLNQQILRDELARRGIDLPALAPVTVPSMGAGTRGSTGPSGTAGPPGPAGAPSTGGGSSPQPQMPPPQTFPMPQPPCLIPNPLGGCLAPSLFG